ncbi:hypothetical protein OROHE_010032 [Orobanche hederae]
MRREFAKRKKVSDSVSSTMFVGVAASRVKDLFASARSFSPSIIFIDEIDAIGSKRGGPDIGGGGAKREQWLLQILTEMDGFKASTSQTGILTARKDLDYIGQEELLEALKRQKGTFEAGKEDSVEVPEELRLRLAYREAAVAVLACYIPDPYHPFIDTDINSINGQPNIRYQVTSSWVVQRKADYVDSIVRACALL